MMALSRRLLFLLTLPCLLAGAGAGGAVEEQPTRITSDGPMDMASTEKETTITWRNKVTVTGTNVRIFCDYLEVVVLRTGDPAATIGKISKFRSLLATGNVRIIQGDREAACGRAVVLPDEDKIVLSEQPVVVFRSENSRVTGKKITLWRGHRRVEVEAPDTVLPALKDLGFAKEPTTAAPPGPGAKPSPTTAPATAPKQP
jgi:hypothetical protein